MTGTRRSRLLALVALAMLAATPAIAATPTTVRVHGTETWTPTMEVALDEVAMLWTGEPRGTNTPPTLVDGTSVLRAGREAAAIRLTGVTTVADLVTRARALREANPRWETRLVLYASGETRNARSRRLLTEEVAVVAEDGTVTREHVTDPLTTLQVAETIAARGGVQRVEPVAQASDYLQARLTRKVAKLKRQDQPSERQEFFALKRVPPGESRIPVERYLQAREQMKRMPLHSTAGGAVRHPSAAELGINFDTAAAFLGPWTPLGPGNIGGRTRALVVDPANPNTLYAGGVAGGVWKTTNGGGAWVALTDTLLPNLAVASLDIDPTSSNILYAGTGEGVFNGDAVRGAGIFKTTDGGVTWNQLATTANADFNFVNKLKVLSTGTSVLAATRTGLWRSMDSGGTWTQVIDASSINGCFDIALGNTYVLASCGTFAQAIVSRSTDGGASFATAFTPPAGGRTSLAIAPSDENIVYALASSIEGGTYNLGLSAVYKSIDGGIEWTPTVTNTSANKLNTLLLTNPVYANYAECGFGPSDSIFNQGWYDNVIAVDPTNPNRVWAGGIDLFRSNDGGTTWALASFWWTGSSPGPFAHADQHAIVFAPDFATSGKMYVGNDGGIFRTLNGATGGTTSNVCNPAGVGIVWTELNNNYGVTQFYHGLPYPGPSGGDTFFGGTQDNGTIRGSVGLGIDGWRQIQGGDGGYVAVNPTNTNVLYAETTGLSITKSVDGGAHFVDAIAGILDQGFLFITPFVMSPNNPQILWTGGDRMWRTTNGAASWTAAGSSFDCGSVSAIAVAPRAGTLEDSRLDQVVLAGTSGGCVFRTATALTGTATTSWTPILSAGDGYVSSIAFDPTNASNVYVTHSQFGVGHVYRSIDGGLTFSNIDGSGSVLPDVPTHTIVVAPGNPNILYVGTDLGVFSSDDGGDNWSVENTGFANVITEALAVGQVGSVDHVFAFTHGRGVFRVALPPSMADIAATQASVPAGAIVAAGGSVMVTDTVKNVGDATATAGFVVGYALVPVNGDGSLGSDIPLSVTRAVGVLSAQGSSQSTTAVGLPDTVAVGPYKIRVRADVLGQVVEDPSVVNNERLTNTFTVTRVDLTVTAASATPVVVGTGLRVSVANTVKNLSATPAPKPFSVTFLLSPGTGTTLAGAEIPLDVTRTVTTLGANATNAATTPVTIPDGTTPGTYRIFVIVDPENAIVESNESNNALASNTLTIGRADLAPQAVTFTPAATGSATAISVTHTVRNVAAGPTAGTAPPSVSGVYLSTDTTLASAVAQLGTVNIPALAVGASSTQTKTFTIPAGPPGAFFVVVRADDAGAITEAGEANNVAASATRLLVGPDLLVTAATATPAFVTPGSTVAVASIVKNQGIAAPTSFGVSFALVPTTDLSGASDIPLAVTRTVAGLGAGASSSTPANVVIPTSVGLGQYRIRVIVDSGNAVNEADETNNQRLTTSVVTVTRPDLIVPTVTAPVAAAPGTPFAVTNTVKNNSSVAAGPFKVAFYLSTDTLFDGADIPISVSRTVTTLAANGVSTATNMVTIPPGTPIGVYRILVVADPLNQVVELDENNNTGVSGPVVLGPDLVVTAATVTPTTVAPGGRISVANTIKNQGVTAATASSLVGFFLSTDAVLDVADVPLGPSRTVVPLGAGLSSAGTSPLTIPPGTVPGSYRILVVADVGNTVTEGNEANNVLATVPITVVLPDLIVTTVTAPAAVAAGTPFAVTNTVENNSGVLAPGPFSVAFFLSTDTTFDGGDIPLGATRTVASLGPNALNTASTPLTIPVGTPPGVYRILVAADATNIVVETSNLNNVGTSAAVTVGPDLVISPLTVPALIAGRTGVGIANTVKNNGAAAATAGAFGVGLYFSSTSTTNTTGDTLVGNRPVTGLAGGGTSSVPVTITVPSTPGNFFLKAFADHTNLVVEADESNNVTVKPVAVVPDLVRTNVLANATFKITPDSPTCLVGSTGGGQAIETITTQTGGSFSGGKITFHDAEGGSDTINFSGTITPAGTVSGTFTLSRVGGGGGSAGGTFTGSAGVDASRSAGSLSLEFTGRSTAGIGSCAVTALVTDGTGSLTNPSVVPASLTVDERSSVTVTFGTSTPWPADGLLRITFPAGFGLVGGSDVFSATGPDGSFFTSTSGQTLTLLRLGDGTTFSGNASFTFDGSFGGILNPVAFGPTGTFLLRTTTAEGIVVDSERFLIDSGTAPSVTLEPGAITNASVTPASLLAGAIGNVAVNFTTTHIWPPDGTLRIDFPAGFDVSSASFVGTSFGPIGTFSLAVSGQTVTLTRIGGGDLPFGGSASLTLDGVQNPATSGTTGSFSLTTATATAGAIDIGTAPGVTIVP